MGLVKISEEKEGLTIYVRDKESMPIRFLRRIRHWTDGAIIGSKVLVQDVASSFEDRERILKKQLSTPFASMPDVPQSNLYFVFLYNLL